MGSYTHLISQSVAPVGAKRIVVFDENGRRCGSIPLGRLTPPDRSKRLYSFGAISDMHVGEKPYDPENKLVPNYDNFIAALKYMNADDDIKFVINSGDLIVWVTEESARLQGKEKTALQREHIEKYAELVSTHLPDKVMFVTPGNHEWLSWYRDTGENQEWYMVNWLHEYCGWQYSDNEGEEGFAEVVKTIHLNEKGEIDENGNDVLILLACYLYETGQVSHTFTGSDFTINKLEPIGENGSVKTQIVVNDENFVWNKEWFGSEFKITDVGQENPSIKGYTLKITGVPEWASVVGYSVSDAQGNILTINADLDENVIIPEGGVTFTSDYFPQSQLYLAQNNRVVKVSEEQLYEKIEDLFESLKAQGKRVFVVQHVPVGQYARDDDINPTNSYYLSRSLFYDTAAVFSGHTHYGFEYHPDKKKNPRHSFDTLAGCNSIHIPSIYDCAQGYIVDVYENGIHLRGHRFASNGAEEIAMGTYWIDT